MGYPGSDYEERKYWEKRCAEEREYREYIQMKEEIRELKKKLEEC